MSFCRPRSSSATGRIAGSPTPSHRRACPVARTTTLTVTACLLDVLRAGRGPLGGDDERDALAVWRNRCAAAGSASRARRVPPASCHPAASSQNAPSCRPTTIVPGPVGFAAGLASVSSACFPSASRTGGFGGSLAPSGERGCREAGPRGEARQPAEGRASGRTWFGTLRSRGRRPRPEAARRLASAEVWGGAGGIPPPARGPPAPPR